MSTKKPTAAQKKTVVELMESGKTLEEIVTADPTLKAAATAAAATPTATGSTAGHSKKDPEFVPF